MSTLDLPKPNLLNSIFAKCLALIAATACVLVVVLSYNSYAKTVGITTEIVANMAIANTASAANGFGDHLANGQPDPVVEAARSAIGQSDGLADLALIFDADGTLVAQTNDATQEDISALWALATQSLQRQDVVQNLETLDTAVPYRDGSGNPVGVLVIDWSSANVIASIQSASIKSLAVAAGLLAAALAGAFYLLRSFLGTPLKGLNEGVRNVSDGNYTSVVPGIARQDEFGSLAKQLDVMRQSLADAQGATIETARKQEAQADLIHNLRSALKNLAAGHLSAGIRSDVAPEYTDLVTDFNAAATAFHDAMSQVVQLSDKIRQDSSDIKSYSGDLSQRTENQAATLEETAAALDDLTNGVRGAADGTREVEGIVQKARSEAEESGEVVQKTISAMSEISESSNQISAIIAVIDDIAFQTNLLALNAGVEAARAGEAGRGFAVVASEVRALAQRSSEAAHEIKTLISGSSEHVANGVSLVAQAGEALTAITDRVVHIAALMSDMANNAQEQATSLDEINVGVGQLDQVTQRNASMVEEATTATLSLEAQSSALSSLVAQFTLDGKTAHDTYVLKERVA